MSANSLFHGPDPTSRPYDGIGTKPDRARCITERYAWGVGQVCFDFLKKYNFIPTFKCIINKFVRTRSTRFFIFREQKFLRAKKKPLPPSRQCSFLKFFAPCRGRFSPFLFRFFFALAERERGWGPKFWAQSSGPNVFLGGDKPLSPPSDPKVFGFYVT